MLWNYSITACKKDKNVILFSIVNAERNRSKNFFGLFTAIPIEFEKKYFSDAPRRMVDSFALQKPACAVRISCGAYLKGV